MRRWIEGRALPYRRRRWALASMLGTAETDLWPELRTAQPRTVEVVAVYPHLGTVPQDVWLNLYGLAEHAIDIIDADGPFVVCDDTVVTTLADRARAGADVRICITSRGLVERTVEPRMSLPAVDADPALKRYAPLRDNDHVQVRLYRGALYSFIYRADDQLLVAQRAYRVPAAEVPVLHLRWADGGDMFPAYVESFERTWAEACPVNWPGGIPGN